MSSVLPSSKSFKSDIPTCIYLFADRDEWSLCRIDHRVMVNSKEERPSIEIFYNTKLNRQISPALSIIL